MGGSICNYNKDNQCIPTSFTNLPISNENHKKNTKHPYKYYSQIKSAPNVIINNISQIKNNTKNKNIININKEIIKSKNVSNSDLNNIETNENGNSHIKNIKIELDFEKIKSDIIKKFDNEIKKFTEYISESKFNTFYNIKPITKQLKEYIDENFDINNIINKKSSEIFSKPPLLFKKDKSIYKGSFNLKGKKEGFGILIDSSGNKYIGEWKNDLFHGKGILISINGDFYQGNFISGRIEGNGIYYSSKNKYNYTGDFYNNKFDGKGKIIYEKNDTNNIYNYYEGDFSVGYMHGEGNLFFTDGSYYKGDFDKNYFEGDGTFIFQNGRKYTGNWKKNSMDGIGVFTWEDGTKYKGQYKNNMKQGNGVYSFGANLYDGVWMDNLPHGKGMLLNEGLRIEGIFSYGKIVEIINSKSANKDLFFKLSVINSNNEESVKRIYSKNSLPKFQTSLTPVNKNRQRFSQSDRNLDINFFIKLAELDKKRKSIFNQNDSFIND